MLINLLVYGHRFLFCLHNWDYPYVLAVRYVCVGQETPDKQSPASEKGY